MDGFQKLRGFEKLRKYAPGQERDDRGRFGDGSSSVADREKIDSMKDEKGVFRPEREATMRSEVSDKPTSTLAVREKALTKEISKEIKGQGGAWKMVGNGAVRGMGAAGLTSVRPMASATGAGMFRVTQFTGRDENPSHESNHDTVKEAFEKANSLLGKSAKGGNMDGFDKLKQFEQLRKAEMDMAGMKEMCDKMEKECAADPSPENKKKLAEMKAKMSELEEE